MKQDIIRETDTMNIKPVILLMILLFITLQIGFHLTYIKYFPEFKNFTWLHHIHGALMASWVMLLVIQPVLIYKGKYKAHLFFGKLSYVIAPLMIISMCLILRFSYNKATINYTFKDVFPWQSFTIMQLFNFTLFYSLGVINRKNTFKHMRYIIGTALVLISPTLGRVLYEYFGITGPHPLYLSTALAAIFLIIDIIKKQNWVPYTIVLIGFLLAVLIYNARFSDAWLTFGNFVVKNLY